MPTEEITIEHLVNWYCEEHNIILWKDIPGYEGVYQVSNVGGMVMNKKTGHIIAIDNSHGYHRVCLWKGGTGKHHFIHVLVAKTWIPNPFNYSEVNHIDEVKTSNNAGNLEWCDRKYNINWGTGRKRQAESHNKAILQFSVSGELICEHPSVKEAAMSVKRHPGNIINCCKGKCSVKTVGGYVWRYKKG